MWHNYHVMIDCAQIDIHVFFTHKNSTTITYVNPFNEKYYFYVYMYICMYSMYLAREMYKFHGTLPGTWYLVPTVEV